MTWSGETFSSSADGMLGPAFDHKAPSQRIKAAIPAYISVPYTWAYLNRRNARLLDNDAVVGAILLGNHRRLRQAIVSEIEPGHHVLQLSHVYGCLISEIARRVGPNGHLDVIDLVPLQVALCRRKLRGFHHSRARVADASVRADRSYDVISSFFLLHEIPDDTKQAVVDASLSRLAPGGKAVFIDYHEPRLRPLRGLFKFMFEFMEPYAESLWRHEVRDFASRPDAYRWKKSTVFGGLYQKTVAYRIG